jgi:hypothetical protein
MNYLELLVIISFILIFAILIINTDLSRRKFKYEKKAYAIELLNESLSELFSNQ